MDNNLKIELEENQFFWPLTYLSLIITATYIFMTVGKRPGYVAFTVKDSGEELSEVDEDEFQVWVHDTERDEEEPDADSLRENLLEDHQHQAVLQREGEEYPLQILVHSRSSL